MIFLTLFISTYVLVYFISILLWPCYENVILIPPFVLLLFQIDHGHFIRSLHQKRTTSNDLVFVVHHFLIFQFIRKYSIAARHCFRIVLRVFDELRPPMHLPTTKTGSLFVVSFWSEILLKPSWSICNNCKTNGGIKIKFLQCDHNSITIK